MGSGGVGVVPALAAAELAAVSAVRREADCPVESGSTWDRIVVLGKVKTGLWVASDGLSAVILVPSFPQATSHNAATIRSDRTLAMLPLSITRTEDTTERQIAPAQLCA